MTSRHDDLEASIAELRACMDDAPEEMRPILLQQIEALKSAQASLARVAPAIAENVARRAPISAQMATFFKPEPAAPVPLWLPDTLTRGQAHASMMRCPQGAEVYEDQYTMSCAVPQGRGSIPVAHGLALRFYVSTGTLESQRFYDRGLLRWAVHYHPLGARSSVGFYADVERLVHVEHGLQTNYAPNGTPTSQATYHHGVHHGWQKLWEDDGYPICAKLYDRGVEVETVMPDGSRLPR